MSQDTDCYTFSKAKRLLTPKDFKRVFDAPERKLHQIHLMAFVRSNDLDGARVGMAITKRKVPTAVGRNMIKRQIREQFRVNFNNIKNKDIVFIIKKPIDKLKKEDLKIQVINILNKIK